MPDQPSLLVVDDEEVIGEACRRVFTRQGFDVDVSTDPDEGLKLAQKGDYRAVLLDVVMPRMDGVRFLETLRATHPNLPVLIMTGYPGIATATACIRLGAADYITKPFTLEELTRAVHRVLRLSPGEVGAPGGTSQGSKTAEPAFSGPALGDETLFWEEAWLRLSKDGMAWVGAVLPGVREAGLKSVQLPRIGQTVYQGLPLAGVLLADNRWGGEYWAYEESTSPDVSVQGHHALAIPSPVTGTVVNVNECLQQEPGLLVSEPCGRGWIACVCPTSCEEEAAQWRPRRVVLFTSPQSVGGGQRRRLAALGCQVVEATGREALVAAVCDQEVDVLVLDGRAWGDQGPAWVEQILSLAPSMKVIVVAGSDPQTETAYRRHRIFYYAVEPVADGEMADVLEAAFRSSHRPRACKADRRKGGGEPISGFAITHRNGQKVQLYAGPGLLRRNEGLGGQIVQRLLDRAQPVVVIVHEANLHPAALAKAAEACDRLIVLTAEDTGLLPGSLSRQAKPEFAAVPDWAANKMVRLTIQPDAMGGLDGLDPRTTSALAEHIVREMSQ